VFTHRKADRIASVERGFDMSPTTVLAFVATAMAFIYGIGWYLQGLSLSRLGMGSLLIARESAIASGMTYMMLLAPLIVCGYSAHYLPIWLVKQKMSYKQARFLGVTFPGFLSLGMSWALMALTSIRMVHLVAGHFTESDPPKLFVLGAVNVLLTILVTLSLYFRKQLVLLFCAPLLYWHCQLFGLVVLPMMPSSFGGYNQQDVVIRLDSDSNFRTACIVASDSRDVILVSNWLNEKYGFAPRNADWNKKQHWGRLLRLPWSRIVEMQDAGVEQNGQWEPVQMPWIKPSFSGLTNGDEGEPSTSLTPGSP
jgi:hypothetical protein